MANEQVKLVITNSVVVGYVVMKSRCQPDINWIMMLLMVDVPIFYREKTMYKDTFSHQISS